jgi:hypothetical protein
VFYIITFKGDTTEAERRFQAFDLFSIADLNLADLGAAAATITQAGMTIKLNIDNKRILEALEAKVGGHQNFSLIEHPELGNQPVGALIERLVGGSIFLPLWQFFMFQPNDTIALQKLGQNYLQFSSSIQQAFQVATTCCLHNTTTFTANHVAFACKSLFHFITANIKCLKVSNSVGDITVLESSKLALQTHEVITNIEKAEQEFNLRNFTQYGVYVRRGIPHCKYPGSDSMVGNYERRLDALIEVPVEHMLPLRDEERSRETSQIHINDQKRSLINTSTAGDGGLMAHNVELYTGDYFSAIVVVTVWLSGVTLQRVIELGFVAMRETFGHALQSRVSRPKLDYQKVTTQ